MRRSLAGHQKDREWPWNMPCFPCVCIHCHNWPDSQRV